MREAWYLRLRRWLCEKAGHPFIAKGWIYDGRYHRDCRLCNSIVSEPIRTRGSR